MSGKKPAKGRPESAPTPVLKQGSYVFRDGSTYNGEYAEVKSTTDPGTVIQRHGTGTFENKETGLLYIGGWEADKMSGTGSMRYSDKSSYEGSWKDGLFQGAGCYTYPDGSKYDGDFDKGLPQGPGKVIDANGQKWAGSFNGGKGLGLVPEIA
ncbi:hypothetical protein SmJEL517_g05590 [Synchytrium microbalum]|uniref:MORN repeat-containing protein 5 n=1 Tax=Synchytrium microbalum TaxID=1806994 RepID=A0A507BYQ5_9FUNG|nr:uncharacterized protein SmJEL517_g05590 [Synchytrium microbalum]TPX30934.1 hypothetical protein SmJEL517_g05590 [Synchytrium microbalum]